jgi:predicted AAA+ superfamily ATPase
MVKRALSNLLSQSKKSILLLGPRQTGKSTLIGSLKPDLKINLSSEKTFLEFLRNNDELEDRIRRELPKSIFIDEVQRIPSLLNTIQSLIDENKSLKFYLSGSSARKLRRGSANLLPGRLHTYRLSGLTIGEIGKEFDLDRALSLGTLPGIYLEPDQRDALKTLRSYTNTYLKEEIQAEALTKNLEGFARFLTVICAYCGQHIDYSKISKQAQVARSSVIRYTEILEDTLIVETIYPFAESDKQRLIKHPKLYFFDCGVLNALLENFRPSPERIGFLFENLVYSQIRAAGFVLDKDIQIYSYRTEHHSEVDFILKLDGEVIAVEVKAAKTADKVAGRGFQSLQQSYGKKTRNFIVHMGTTNKSFANFDALNLPTFLKEVGLV